MHRDNHDPARIMSKEGATKRKNRKTGDDGRDDTSYPTKNAKRPN